MNARFWIWHNDGMVKITLAPEARLELRYGGPTDEGYSYAHIQYIHCGRYVNRLIATMASDCDGRFDNYSDYTCLISELRSEFNDYNGLMMPNWERESVSQRDYVAEAAGY